MKQRKKLPIGIQSLSKIRDKKKNYAYVDKTDLALSLLNNSDYYFLSRPRRFGKSLFLDTLAEILQGRKELFEELYIYDKWDWEEKFPVIRIDLGTGDYSSPNRIRKVMLHNLKSNAEDLGVDLVMDDIDSIGIHFSELIKKTSRKYKQPVAILIDEYDKPILDNITKPEMAAEARDLLRTFYSSIKSNDAYLRFVFITGVSKFSKLNLFSGLNNLEDITIDQKYATITGYTHHDIETVFADYTHGVDMEELRRWYNGYNYFGEPVYNPYDVLLFFSKGNVFDNYWCETGNPKFLIDTLKEKPQALPELQNIVVDKATLSTFDVEHIELPALLWQTGYLTFAGKQSRLGRISYTLKVPNVEVLTALNDLFLGYLVKIGNKTETFRLHTIDALLDASPELLKKHLKSLFAAIPYDNYTRNNIANFEGYYASVIYAFLCSLGFDVLTEDHTNTGRVDMTLIGPEQIFILEFKVDMPAEAALEQIKSKRYYEKYTALGKKIYLLGLHFDSEKRNIAGFEWEEFA